jgi:hypothetical protein
MTKEGNVAVSQGENWTAVSSLLHSPHSLDSVQVFPYAMVLTPKSLVPQLPKILSTTLYIAQFVTGAATVGLYAKQHGYWLNHGLPSLIVCWTPFPLRHALLPERISS